MAPIKTNALFCGDNLAILREYLDDESVDLVYLFVRRRSVTAPQVDRRSPIAAA